MEEVVEIGRTTSLYVALSLKDISHNDLAAFSSGKLAADPNNKIIVQVMSRRNFKYAGESRTEIDPPTDEEDRELYFDLVPTDVGEGELWVVLRQGQKPLLTLKLVCRISSTKEYPTGTISDDAVAVKPEPEHYPLNQLIIIEREFGESYGFQ